MSLHAILAVSALAASAALFLSSASRALATVALVASGIEVAMALGLLRLTVANVPLGIVLGLALAVPGLLAWLRTSAKTATSAAAIVAFVGALQVVSAIGGRL
jgi:hypothetical protein